jgi:hypothetical protein
MAFSCSAIDDVEGIRILMRRAFEQAFSQQIMALFKVYTTNAPTVKDQQEFTRRGIENAVAAYRLAMTAVDEWGG